jgi:hypothetical protein
MDFVNRAVQGVMTSIQQGKFRSQLTHTLAQLARSVKPLKPDFSLRAGGWRQASCLP